MDVVLETRGLTRTFGRVVAADDVNVQIRSGERVGLVGPNGAGKTTFLNLITGYVRPNRGRILYRGTDITGLPPRAITRMGIVRSFQIPQLYPGLTVLENLLLAIAARSGRGLDFWGPLGREHAVAEAMELLGAFQLADYAWRPVGELPEGGRKLLDVAMALALRPTVLLMDEPTSGVSTQDKFGVMEVLMEVLGRAGVTTLFVEHDMEVVYRYAERVLVFHNGRVVADGDPQALFADAQIRRAVLGWE
ncbi:MAG: ABC transporter ATP-binding protein [Thermoflexus sp.]|jgi:branched-chain amino acid transport system ATP-binding protein|nr:ABC transporter ATP-binding protein [Thermoflexus sp.]MDT7884436.1 ABC transporter ATP-binding protein [Thermoflexus sp.]MDT7947851.1 ABC transporter ATP-binding protein [Thermoflexus sp.]